MEDLPSQYQSVSSNFDMYSEFYCQSRIKVLVQGGGGPALKPRCEFGESRILGKNTYIFTTMTQTSMQKNYNRQGLKSILNSPFQTKVQMTVSETGTDVTSGYLGDNKNRHSYYPQPTVFYCFRELNSKMYSEYFNTP